MNLSALVERFRAAQPLYFTQLVVEAMASEYHLP